MKEPGNHNYVLYTDASGDDGVNFSNSGTSRTYVVACFASHVNDIEYNERILLDIKKILRCKPSDEIKSSHIIRHKEFPKVLDKINELKGYIKLHVVFKEKLECYGEGKNDVIYWPCLEHEKNFTAYCHASSIVFFPNLFTDMQFLAVVDNMKVSEMRRTEVFKDVISESDNVKLKFVDSKSKDHVLLQIADLFAGYARRTFEDHLKAKGLLNCRCITCNQKKRLCRGNFGLVATGFRGFRPIYDKLPGTGVNKVIYGITFYPPYYSAFTFLTCMFK